MAEYMESLAKRTEAKLRFGVEAPSPSEEAKKDSAQLNVHL